MPTEAVYETNVSVNPTGLTACFPCFLAKAFPSKAEARERSILAKVLEPTVLTLDARLNMNVLASR
jgi:hypothetical protein